MAKDFVKLFGKGDKQVVFILREIAGGSEIQMTYKIPGVGVVDSRFGYEDSDAGTKRARERFDALDASVVKRLVKDVGLFEGRL